MSPSARLLAAFLAARAAFGLAYLIGSLRRSPIPWYLPLERAWSFGAEPPGLAMEWFGRTAAALAAALLAGALAWSAAALPAVARALARPPFVLALARASALILLVDFAYFGWALMHQPPPAALCPP